MTKGRVALLGLSAVAFTFWAGAVSQGSPRIVQSATEQAEQVTTPTEEGESMEGVQRTVEFENNRVSIVRYRFAPHAKIPMHDAPDVVAVWLTDAHLKLTFPDGTTKLENHKAGETEWSPAASHAGENLADAPLEFISVQLKDGVEATPSH